MTDDVIEQYPGISQPQYQMIKLDSQLNVHIIHMLILFVHSALFMLHETGAL